MLRKLTIAAALAAGVAIFYLAGGEQLLTLAGLKAELGRLAAWRAEAPLTVALCYFVVYVAVVAVTLPGAAVMTLAGGALFGLGWGTLIVSFASTAGATLAFWASRHLLRDWVQGRFGERLRDLNQGFARDGAYYLFALRLVPVFPFFLVNLLMGLVPIRTRTFYWVSQLGMIPGTLVYVNAGTQLAQLDSLAGILSPGVLLSFALLGVFPWIARALLEFVRRRRVYAPFRRPRRFDRNLVVIGAGATGLVTAYLAAALKARVTLVESGPMGGDCLNTGCVPSKALIATARLAHRIRQAGDHGLRTAAPEVDFRAVMTRVREVIRRIEPHDSVARYTALGVEVLCGHGRLVDPWTVEVRLNGGGVQRLSTRSIVIATGARPVVPPLPGLDAVGYHTSETLWEALAGLEAPPPRMVILGGGPIGCELAQAFARLGSAVTLVELAPRLLPREDDDVAAVVRAALERDGVAVRVGHRALRAERTPAGPQGERVLVVGDGTGEHRLGFDLLLLAVGRAARLDGFGLEELGVPVDRVVTTNAWLQTRFPNIYAAGDVAGPLQLTHAGAHQARYAAVNALFGRFWRTRVDSRVIPAAVFVDPEVARVGLNEREAVERGIPHELTRTALGDLDRAIADGAPQGFVKLLTVPGKDRLLGATIVGEHAGELLAEFALAMRNGLGLGHVLDTVHSYPTFAEVNRAAAGEWKRAHAPQAVLRLLERYHRWERG